MNHPIDITWSLHTLTHRENDEKQLTEAIYNLQAIAENKYNSEYWRILYKTLSDIADLDSVAALPF